MCLSSRARSHWFQRSLKTSWLWLDIYITLNITDRDVFLCLPLMLCPLYEVLGLHMSHCVFCVTASFIFISKELWNIITSFKKLLNKELVLELWGALTVLAPCWLPAPDKHLHAADTRGGLLAHVPPYRSLVMKVGEDDSKGPCVPTRPE